MSRRHAKGLWSEANGSKRMSPWVVSLRNETHLVCVVAWWDGVRRCTTIIVKILLFFPQDFALLQGRLVEIVQTWPLISLLRYHPGCRCLLSSVFEWKAVSVRNNFYCKIQKTQLIVVYDIKYLLHIYYLLNSRDRWSQGFFISSAVL